jgi:tetratricopeptide (TPR) repeat protein
MKKLFLFAASALFALGMNAQTTYLEYCNAGDACFSNSDFKGAIENYIKALELDSTKTDYTTAMQLGSCYEQIEDWQKAGDAFKDSYMRGNYDAGVINNMKRCYETVGCTDCLKNAYNEIAETYPDQQYAMAKRLYNLYIKEQDNANSLKCIETMLQDPEITEENRLKYLKNAASFALKLDSTDIAESYYEKVLEIVPNDADIHKALGIGLYNQIGNIDKNAKAVYAAKQKAGNASRHDYSVMLTATKRATLKYGPKAVEHLKIANQTMNDPEITKIVAKLQNNIAAYSNR